jgi:hypothetical protein
VIGPEYSRAMNKIRLNELQRNFVSEFCGCSRWGNWLPPWKNSLSKQSLKRYREACTLT